MYHGQRLHSGHSDETCSPILLHDTDGSEILISGTIPHLTVEALFRFTALHSDSETYL